MFSKSRTNATKTGAAVPAPSIISADMRVSGDLRTEGDVQLDGVVDGDVQATTLTIGTTAEVNGEIVADAVRVLGKVQGRIRARDVILLPTAQVHGDILHESLEIARGARVEGLVKRLPADEAKPPKVNLVVAGGEPPATGTAGRASRTDGR